MARRSKKVDDAFVAGVFSGMMLQRFLPLAERKFRPSDQVGADYPKLVIPELVQPKKGKGHPRIRRTK